MARRRSVLAWSTALWTCLVSFPVAVGWIGEEDSEWNIFLMILDERKYRESIGVFSWTEQTVHLTQLVHLALRLWEEVFQVVVCGHDLLDLRFVLRIREGAQDSKRILEEKQITIFWAFSKKREREKERKKENYVEQTSIAAPLAMLSRISTWRCSEVKSCWSWWRRGGEKRGMGREVRNRVNRVNMEIYFTAKKI